MTVATPDRIRRDPSPPPTPHAAALPSGRTDLPFSVLVEDFLRYLREYRRGSPLTADAYGRDAAEAVRLVQSLLDRKALSAQ